MGHAKSGTHAMNQHLGRRVRTAKTVSGIILDLMDVQSVPSLLVVIKEQPGVGVREVNFASGISVSRNARWTPVTEKI